MIEEILLSMIQLTNQLNWTGQWNDQNFRSKILTLLIIFEIWNDPIWIFLLLYVSLFMVFKLKG